MSVKTELLALSDLWITRLRTRLEGLTDEEFFWEPAPDCWTLREDGSGWRPDFGLVFTEEAPVTTIGWRLWHIIDMLKEDRCALLLGLEPEASAAETWVPASANEALDMLDRAYAAWRRYLEATDEAQLDAPIPRSFNDIESTRLTFVLHMLDEYVHHGAEVALLRDLWRASRPRDGFVTACLRADRVTVDALRASDPAVVDRTIGDRPDLMVEAAATAHWDAIPLLIELGFPVNGSTGRSALHHAAADGRLDLVRLLVEHGADINALDPIFNVPPVQWANFFSRSDVAAFLTDRYKEAQRS
jgi:uncharacterized damage-inducible protein DinB